eukprot:gene14709-14834_t
MLGIADVITDNRPNSVNVSVDQRKRERRPLFTLAHQRTERRCDPGDQREFVGGPKSLEIMGVHIKLVRRLLIESLFGNPGAGGVELCDLLDDSSFNAASAFASASALNKPDLGPRRAFNRPSFDGCNQPSTVDPHDPETR